MKSFLVIMIVLAAECAASESHDVEIRRLQVSGEIPYDPSVDVCKTGETSDGQNTYGACDPTTQFPTCNDGYKHCYHRINRRDLWYEDKQPHYYIDPRRIVCAPNRAQCRTCTPGRYCLSEQRCILDDQMYGNCATWY